VGSWHPHHDIVSIVAFDGCSSERGMDGLVHFGGFQAVALRHVTLIVDLQLWRADFRLEFDIRHAGVLLKDVLPSPTIILLQVARHCDVAIEITGKH
jgi:hypothetical protein